MITCKIPGPAIIAERREGAAKRPQSMNLRGIGIAPSFKSDLDRTPIRRHREVDRLEETAVAHGEAGAIRIHRHPLVTRADNGKSATIAGSKHAGAAG